ncbi:helicase [Aureococcus anophagefferens]|nr:helicase [Aureococcus anophagefferens]
MAEQRAKLPAYARGELAARVAGPVAVVAGATGCGKSTQVPQLLLEDADAAGARCKVVVTQPRRVAAVALAERVAAERGEACRLGDGDVGYSVRLERRGSSRTRLEFCTVGVLLRRLQRGGAFDATHVVVDEAHERDVLTDFLLVVLKTRVLPACPGLKVVVMSATLNAALFADYFGGAAVLDIPGRLHDVAVRPATTASRRPPTGPSTSTSSAPSSPAAAATNDDGAILVFAPGAAEIDALVRELRRSLGDGAWVLPMHGGLTSRDQHRVFQRPPPGARKVVVATNVAETSITIDDVDCVVDLGRVKELRYVSAADVSALAEVYTSRAAATQRAGRAGRVRAGACYRLYPRKLHDEGLPAHTAPEMLRTPLADVVLKVLRLGFGGPKAFLARALQPPRPESVDAALRDLVAVGAVAGGAPPEEVREASDDDDDDDEAPEQDGDLFSLGAGVQGLLMGDSSDDSDGDDDGAAPADDGEAWVLTTLGRHVADLPMDCRVAKLLIYGAIFGAAEPCLTLAAGMSLPKGVFVAPFHKRKEAAAAKRRFARGSESDLLAVVGAYEARGALDRRDVPGFCRDHFLHAAALGDLTGLRNQFRGHLRDAGLLGDEEAVTLDETSSLLRGLLCAGLYPHVARLAGDAPHLRCRDRSKWWCHPQSLNFETLAPRGKLKERRTTYVVYNARLKTSKPYLLDTSVVHPLALLLFGGALRESLDGTRVVLDGWLPFKATKHAQLAVLALRGEIDALLAAAVDADARARPAAEAQRRLVVAAVRNLLAMLTPS